MKVEKFPQILFQGRELLWDLRQLPYLSSIETAQIVIRDGIDLETEKKLRALSAGKPVLVEKKDFSSWGNLCAEFLSGSAGDLTKKAAPQLKIIGIVGTNGKTTTAAILRFLLVKRGKKVLELGTLGAQLWKGGDNEAPLFYESTGFTSPEAQTLHSLLKQAGEENVEYLVMEVTSHAIALGRVEGVEFDAAIFLNFSQDHLDFHKTLEEYKRVKKSFFTQHLSSQPSKKEPLIVLNSNDPVGRELSLELAKLAPTQLLRGGGYSVHEDLLELTITIAAKKATYPFVGHFQAENLLASAEIVSQLLQLSRGEVMADLRDFPGLPGRMEVLHLTYQGKRRTFIVDFAHTPDALEKSLQSLKKGMKKGRLWVLFGCGGDRDALKRPIMGEIAAQFAEGIVVTSDNPRSEDPQKIIDAIVLPLLKRKVPFKSFVSRKEAMCYALANMGEHDLCLVAGRGHEEF